MNLAPPAGLLLSAPGCIVGGYCNICIFSSEWERKKDIVATVPLSMRTREGACWKAFSVCVIFQGVNIQPLRDKSIKSFTFSHTQMIGTEILTDVNKQNALTFALRGHDIWILSSGKSVRLFSFYWADSLWSAWNYNKITKKALKIFHNNGMYK